MDSLSPVQVAWRSAPRTLRAISTLTRSRGSEAWEPEGTPPQCAQRGAHDLQRRCHPDSARDCRRRARPDGTLPTVLLTTDPVRRATTVVAGPAAKAARDVVRAASGA